MMLPCFKSKSSKPRIELPVSLSLAFAAAKVGGTAPTVLNAANEIAVAAFLDEGMPYLQIPSVVENTLNTLSVSDADSIESILEIDAQAREVARNFIKTLSS